jgi:glutaredoxin
LIGDNGEKITIKEGKEENGMYKITVIVAGGQEVETYLTKDGKLFFDRTMNIEEIEKESQAAKDAETAVPIEAVKSDKPTVELFVMSHCPYGTQIEKGILPAVEALGDKVNFEIKFVDYAMHGETELNEQLKQHCIKTEEPAKFTNYLKCFLEDGDSDRCSTKANINISKINSCVSATDKEFDVTKNFTDKISYKGSYPSFNIYKEDNEKYSVGGSPTLVINGTTVKSKRDSASLLVAVCSAFNIAPEECSTELSSAEPTPGFGTGTSASGSSGTDASCN